jgi:hypothetical protein
MNVWVLNIYTGGAEYEHKETHVFNTRNTALAYLQKAYDDVQASLEDETNSSGDISGTFSDEFNPLCSFTIDEHTVCRME